MLAVRLLLEGSYLLGLGAFEATAAARSYGLLWILGGGLVGSGVLTPIVQTVVAIVSLSRSVTELWAGGLALAEHDLWQAHILEAGISFSLALLGPGAYSVDARLFGREEIVIPARKQMLAGESYPSNAADAAKLTGMRADLALENATARDVLDRTP